MKAFPIKSVNPFDDKEGMDLRDYFAAKIMQSDECEEVMSDNVNNPSHYTDGGIETIDFIEAKQLDYLLGNCVKYISRAGKKSMSSVEDLKKAKWYLERKINNLESKK